MAHVGGRYSGLSGIDSSALRVAALLVDTNPCMNAKPTMTNASTNKIHKKLLMRQVEHWLVGTAMMIIAYLIERAVLRSIRRSPRKATLPDGTPS